MFNYYEILELRNDATISEIKLAYKKLIYRCHPDVTKDNSRVEQFKLVIKAYKTLSNPSKRLDYDRSLQNYKITEEKENIIKQSVEKHSKKIKFIFKEVFNKNKLEDLFFNIKKARSELRRKRFVEREKNKLIINENTDFYDELNSIQLLARLKSSSNQYVRSNAARVIGKKHDKSFFFDLIKALSDSSKFVRKEVVRSLGILRDYRSLNFLLNTVYDYEEEVRIEVAKVLRNFADTRAVSGLLKLLNDKNDQVVVESIYSLGVIGDKEISKEIRKLLRHPSIKVKRASLEVIKILR